MQDSKCTNCGTAISFGDGQATGNGIICNDCDPEDVKPTVGPNE